MSAKAIHLNLLSEQERQSSSTAHFKLILPVLSGGLLAIVLIWGCLVVSKFIIANFRIGRIRDQIQAHQEQSSKSESLKLELRNLQAEVDQFEYYLKGRLTRGELLKHLALVVPEGITLTQLIIPPQPPQNLQPPPGIIAPALQGPTQNVERVTLQLTGLARNERDVFQLMENLKDKSFANDLVITDSSVRPEDASPKVLAFRQESPQADGGHRGVFFDILYQLKPREFAK